MDVTLFADGFDEAIIGLNVTSKPERVVYSKEKMVEILSEELKDDSEDSVMEAVEYLEFNTWGAYVGEGTPIYLEDRFEDYECDEDEEEDVTFVPMSKEEIINFLNAED